jgi:hypothetical protein
MLKLLCIVALASAQVQPAILAFDDGTNQCEFKYENGELANDCVWATTTGGGGPPPGAATSCYDHFVAGQTSSGVYDVDSVNQWCDMTTAGGGWTFVLAVDESGGGYDHFSDKWTSTNGVNWDESANPESLSSSVKTSAYNTVRGIFILAHITCRVRPTLPKSTSGNFQ